MKISGLIHTYNEEDNIGECIKSIRNLVDEIVVVDNYSTDNTRKIAETLKAKVYLHQSFGHVEPSRNFGVTKTKGAWIMVLDADERLSPALINKLKDEAAGDQDVILIPRKNIIFNKWIKYTGWWPDHQARFFKKGKVSWTGQIDVVNINSKKILTLPNEERFSITHYNYQNIYDFIDRLNRYTSYYAERIVANNKKISYSEPLRVGTSEFINRFIISQGYKDGYIGLILSILMSFYFFLSYTKALEIQNKLNEIDNSLFIIQKYSIISAIRLIFWNFIGVYIIETYRIIKRFLIKFKVNNVN